MIKNQVILAFSKIKKVEEQSVQKSIDWAKAAYGCCKGVWGEDPMEYLAQERASWEDDEN